MVPKGLVRLGSATHISHDIMVLGGLAVGLEALEAAAKANNASTPVSMSKEGSEEVVCSWAMKKDASSLLSEGRRGGEK